MSGNNQHPIEGPAGLSGIFALGKQTIITKQKEVAS